MIKNKHKVHHIRYYKPDQLQSINYIAIDHIEKRLALIRRSINVSIENNLINSDIEIWNIDSQNNYYKEKTIYEDDRKTALLLEALCWAENGRLFSIGLNGFINEYNLKTSNIKRSYPLTSGPGLCLSVNEKRNLIAVGTEEGYICVFRLGNGLTDDELNYDQVMTKNDQRIICVDWYQQINKGKEEIFLISGSIGVIKIWNYHKCNCINIIKCNTVDSIVWCLLVLPNFTIVTGDSRGYTSFWNGNTCTQISSFRNHRADVLALTKSLDNNEVYSTGIDPVIYEFRLTNIIDSRFLPDKVLNHHTHDVRAIAIDERGHIFSGGNDTFLMRYSYPPKRIIKKCPDLNNHVHIHNNRVLLQYIDYIEIWNLGKDNLIENEINLQDGMQLNLSECSKNLLQLKMKQNIISSTFNERWIALTTYEEIRIFYYDLNTIEKVQFLFEPIMNLVDLNIELLNDDHLLISVKNVVYLLNLNRNGITMVSKLTLDNLEISTIKRCNDNLFAIATTENTIEVFNVNFEKISTINLKSKPLTIKWSNNIIKKKEKLKNGLLWFTKANNDLVVYSVDNAKSVDLIKLIDLDVNLTIKDLDIDEFSEMIYIHNDEEILKYNLNDKSSTITKKYKYIIKFSLINNLNLNMESTKKKKIKLDNENRLKEMIVVEVTPESIFKELPPPIYIKKFGC